jgi:hypothetical protein
MPLRWKLFRIVCILQMLSASVFAIIGLINLFKSGGFTAIITILLFLLIFLQTILAITILNNNFPDVPVMGKQKTNFNRLYLLNFLFLVFLFGIIFAEYRQLSELAELISKPVYKLPFEFFIYLITNVVILIFQFIILYGMYQLRRELYFNFMKKQFDFEKDQL